MKTPKLIFIVSLVTWLVMTRQVPANQDPPTHQLQVYLPRNITLDKSALCLGDIAVLRGNPVLAENARTIKLGRMFIPNQRVVVNRNTVLSRLATHGISGSQVRLTGAKQVVVQRSGQTIKGADLVALAQAFLQQHYTCSSKFVATPLHTPKDTVVEQQATDIQLIPHLIRGNSYSLVTVRVTVSDGRKSIAQQDIRFRVQYQCQTAVATQDIARGTVLNKNNVKIETHLMPKPQSSQWKAPWGLIAQRPIAKDSQIQANMASTPVPPIMLKRNDLVVIRIERPGFVVTAMGQAQANARSGDVIKVKNSDSQRIILCKVKDNGTVEPIF